MAIPRGASPAAIPVGVGAAPNNQTKGGWALSGEPTHIPLGGWREGGRDTAGDGGDRHAFVHTGGSVLHTGGSVHTVAKNQTYRTLHGTRRVKRGRRACWLAAWQVSISPFRTSCRRSGPPLHEVVRMRREACRGGGPRARRPSRPTFRAGITFRGRAGLRPAPLSNRSGHRFGKRVDDEARLRVRGLARRGDRWAWRPISLSRGRAVREGGVAPRRTMAPCRTMS